jgi:hypothetical protein
MRLSRGYQWKLELSENELNVIRKSLRICVDDRLLDETEDGLADHLFNTIDENHERMLNRRKTANVVEDEEDSD